MLITQNVDGLHDAAGSLNTVDLHGRIDTVRCMDCGKRSARADLQVRLLALNPPGPNCMRLLPLMAMPICKGRTSAALPCRRARIAARA